MTHEDEGHYAAKHKGKDLDERIAASIRDVHQGKEFPCAAAEKIGLDLGVPLPDVGVALDLQEIKIGRCEIGLFGFETANGRHAGFVPAEMVSEEMEQEIQHALVDGRLPCAAAWAIAKAHELSRIEVGSACEKLKIKISKCQIGAF
ncbi:MAG: hypothetical protein JRF63_04515 [Deltaproteobacteria bacterium]|nr:hypothetical protein [Deltaproteobacteria bacterium]